MSTAAAKITKKVEEAEPLQKKVVFDMPRALYRETEILVAQLQTTTSRFLRQAVEKYIEDLHRKQLEEELEAGYLANADSSEQTMSDFELVDEEQLR